MQDVTLNITGLELNFDLARKLALAIAEQDGDDPMLISWNDKLRDKHSPSCVKCELQGAPGWEVYGRNHGGKLRISLNDEDYVFIYG